MKTLLRILLVVGILVVLLVPAYYGGTQYWKLVTRTQWRTVEVEKGGIIAVVNSTGTVKPKMQVTIGSFVSGPLLPEATKPEEIAAEEAQATAWMNDNAEWMAMLPKNERVNPHDFTRVGVQLPDFNDDVQVGKLLAKIDPLLYWANVNRDAAALQNRIADVQRAKAVLQQAINDERRALDLRAEDKTFIAQAEMDKFRFNRMSLDAQVKVAETAVRQALAALKNSLANLKYTRILSPVSGTIIHRKIEPGQTLASQFQSPELFIIGVDMREEVQIHASVDEADIGRIKAAQNKKLPVSFTVDAHEELFHGAIDQIRMNATTTQNVVTYPVVVKTANPDLKLLPGMTAAISFQVDDRQDVVKIPNAALRFYPTPKQVRKEDVPILEGTEVKDNAQEAQQSETTLSAEERAENRRKRNRRHVWVQDGDLLRAIEVVVGLTDSQFTEMVSGNLQPGEKLVIGIQQTQYGR
ncbi:MAG: efflux RND transporter periplasmic adaptor subunit [Planctomycetales bacterium]|nr:efflux RND transporter periplasmic adaptor subunit [Planctomycetales bacterium]